LKERQLVPEWMDDPELDREEHRRALAGLRRVNRLSLTAGRIARSIQAYAATHRLTAASILDLGCGSGDVALGVARTLAKGIDWSIEGWDVSPTAIEVAQQSVAGEKEGQALVAHRPRVSLAFRQRNAFAESTERFDFVYCSLFLHHFNEAEALRLVQQMIGLARLAIIIDDLDRSWFGWWLAKIGVQLLSRSPIVHFDGPQSVRAAFTPAEARQLAQACGVKRLSVERHWPARWLLFAELCS
jgi:2-polyprenyl-3-methyl-5-hydroxy-6-metoxy-1,4-benzoquinol methylase